MTFEPYLIWLDNAWFYIPCSITFEEAKAKGFKVKKLEQCLTGDKK